MTLTLNKKERVALGREIERAGKIIAAGRAGWRKRSSMMLARALVDYYRAINADESKILADAHLGARITAGRMGGGK